MADFLGIKGIEFIWHGAWADPEIRYKKRIFNCWDVQEMLEDTYEEYVELGDIKPVPGGWKDYYAKHPAIVKAYLDDWIWAMDGHPQAKPKVKKKAPAKKGTSPMAEVDKAFAESKKQIKM